jgi:acyl transferase domain-containing protein
MSSTDAEHAVGMPVAIVGMSCRLPGSDGPGGFWRLLESGTDAVSDPPEGRWTDAPADGYRRGGFLADVDRFDAAFFGVSPNEAAAMDPQQRLMLELAWEALEHARTAPTALRDTPAGVFVGAIADEYGRFGEAPGPHTFTGVQRGLIANRVSYLLGLRGPSLTVDTGQSSSLVAVRLACEELRRGTTRVALAGGVNLNLLGATSEVIGAFGALSPDGRCHTFDSRANGYVRGEGGALVVLKPLADALADGDPVHCVILGGAVNNDGGGDGLTVPHGRAQEEVIRLACRDAGITPAGVRYVELHGTGTRAGDPVEAAALAAALGEGRPARQPLMVGSVKTNIGHLEGAAGIAGLLKAVLSIKHRRLVPSLNFETAHPGIPLERLNLEVVRTARDWPDADGRLIAGVSSFGIGGTNCHLVLAEAPPLPEPEPAGPDAVASGGVPLVLSARSAPALSAQAGALGRHLAGRPETPLADVAHSLVRTRSHFEHRAVVLGRHREALDALAGGRPDPSVVAGRAAAGGSVLVFPGQGSQWPGMARQLLARPGVFADRLTERVGARGEPDLGRVDVVQPALWAVMVSLTEVWRAHGVHPEAVIGHSQGEIAAATVVGALSVGDAARVVALRSRALRRVSGGGMMSAGAPPEVVGELLPGAACVTIAAVNGPRSVVLSGPVEGLAALRRTLTGAGYRTKILPVDYASHSPAVDAVREELLDLLSPVRPVSTPAVFISTLTGEPFDTAGLDAGYWFRSLRRPVRFAEATRYALEHGYGRFVECSPHPVLLGSIEESAEAAERDAVAVGTLRREDGGPERVRRSLAEAYAGGAPVTWRIPGRRTDLPVYPFQRERHWLDGPPSTGSAVPRGDAPAAGADPVRAGRPGGAVAAAVAGTSRRELRELVTTAAAAVLGHRGAAEVDPSRTFKDLGFDSSTTVELRNRLRTLTGLRLPSGLLYDFPTPDRVAENLHGRLADGASPATPATEAATAPGERDTDGIAVVAMGCRYPGGVTTPEELWGVLSSGTDAMSGLPTGRGWDLDALFAGASATRHGGFLHDADTFDAAFFGLSPREALAMDPQQRLMLEICWEAVERAGIDPAALAGSATGVFVGAMATDYGPRLHQPNGAADGHLLTGTTLSVASGRIAYTFGLQGPAITVDTACSSSLVAIQLATRALRQGDCSLALAGGVTVMANPGHLVEFSRQNGLSADGRAKAFSADADGTAFAEGAGVLVLERLWDARRNGHPVLAVIRGAAVNSDGASNGLTAPNGQAQQQVIRRTLADAGLGTRDVDAVEAHGTGTTLGDPIEAQALLETYGQDRRETDAPLWLGSVKSNIGHTQAAAGVAGVIKMVQAMRHGTLPRTLHADRPTGRVDWEGSGVRVLTGDQPWPRRDRPRRAAVSSFGISGTNAHLVLEEAGRAGPPVPGPTRRRPVPLLWVVSARSASALRAQAARLGRFAAAADDTELAAATGWLARRAAFEHRAVLLTADRDELCAALAALAEGGAHPALSVGTAARAARPVFVFPGQGAQWERMAVELLDQDETFAAELERCDLALRPHTGWSVREVLTGAEGAPSMEGTDVVQPVLFAVMVSLARLWESAGVRPEAVVGHSQGEIAGAVVAGALPLADAAKVVTARSRLVGAMDGTGGMLAVGLPAAEVRERLAPFTDRLWLAVDNGPAGTVVAGELAAIEEFAAACGERVQLRRAPVAYAAHTPHVEAVRAELLDSIGELAPRDTETAISSSCLGGFLDGSALEAGYWYRNLAEPVSFDAAVRAFADTADPLFIEVSPHPILAGAVQEILADAGIDGGAAGTLRRGEGGARQFLRAVADAFVRGAQIDWPALLGPAGEPVDLPTYAFERERFWLHPAERGAHPLLDTVIPVAEGGGVLLTGRISRTGSPWLADHGVAGTVLLPGTGFAEIALEAAAATGARRVDDLTLHAPLVLPETGAVQLQAAVTGRELTIHARAGADEPWTRYASGSVSGDPPPAPARLGQWPPAGAVPVDLTDAYDRLAARGYHYGPVFQGLTAAWQDGEDIYAEVVLPSGPGDAAVAAEETAAFTVHPALLDAALHPLVLAADELLLPFSFSSLWATARGTDRLRVHLGGGSVTVYDTSGAPVAGIGELTFRPSSRAPGTELYRVEWVPAEPPPVARADRDWAVIGCGGELPEAVPPAVLVQCPAEPAGRHGSGNPEETPEAVRLVLRQVLELIQRWIGDARFAASRLVFLADPESLTGAPVWGLVRSAMAEHPGRFALCAGASDLLAATVEEPQFAVRDGDLLVPRLVRRPAAPAAPQEGLGEGTVLITGGTGGLGALTAARLVTHHGVRDLLLTSRSGDRAPGTADLVRRLEELGASVRVSACDVADRAALTALLDGERLTGVIHAAGVLEDATTAGLTPGHLDAVLRPKADAGWLLHELTAGHPLRAFVLFSSVAGVLGTRGQGNYAAANAFLDALAGHRRALGLPAVSVAWGLWSLPTGMTGGMTAADRRRLGAVAPLSEEQGLQMFDAALGEDAEARIVAARWDLAALRAQLTAADGTGNGVPAVLRGMVRPPRRPAAPAGGAAGTPARTADAESGPAAERFGSAAAVFGFVREQVAVALGHRSAETVDPDRPLRELGMDSLTSVELRNRISTETGLRLPASLVFNHPTITRLAGHLAGLLAPDPEQRLREALERLLPELDSGTATAVLAEALRRAGRPATPAADRATTAPASGPVTAPECVPQAEPEFTTDEELFAFIDAQV